MPWKLIRTTASICTDVTFGMQFPWGSSKRKLYNFLPLCWQMWIFVPFRYFTCLCFQTADVIVELAWLYTMIQAPCFIREPSGTAFFDNIKPFFIWPSGMSFQNKLVRNLYFTSKIHRLSYAAFSANRWIFQAYSVLYCIILLFPIISHSIDLFAKKFYN